MKCRMSVTVHGRVQGVAFRHHTCQKARELGVHGWVRNLPDGSVEGLFEGNSEAVDAMVDWCRSGPPSARVDQIEIRTESFCGEFSGFAITY